MSDQHTNQFTRSPVVAFLATRHEPCPRCNYDLYKVAAEACPECGFPLELHLKGSALRDRSWYIAVISVAMGLGLDLVLTGVSIFDVGQASGFALMAAACTIALWRLFVEEKAWRTHPPRQRAVHAAVVASAALVLHCAWTFWLTR
jgi:ribosomal protein L37E